MPLLSVESLRIGARDEDRTETLPHRTHQSCCARRTFSVPTRLDSTCAHSEPEQTASGMEGNCIPLPNYCRCTFSYHGGQPCITAYVSFLGG